MYLIDTNILNLPYKQKYPGKFPFEIATDFFKLF